MLNTSTRFIRTPNYDDLFFFEDDLPPKVKIVSHFASPPLVANCSRTSTQCLVTPTLPNILVWWTFRGDNASKLPSVHISRTSPNEWKLSIECATLHHSGTWACHAALANETQRVYRKEAVIQVYVPVSIEVVPNNGVVRQLIGNTVQLKCLVTTYPKAVINWTKIVNNVAVNAVSEDDQRLRIVNSDVSETLQSTQLVIDSIRESDNGTYVCHAKNEYNNQSEGHMTLVVIQKAQLYFERTQALSARSLQLFWRVVTDGNADITAFILEMKNYTTDEHNDQQWHRIDAHLDVNAVQTGSYHIVHYLAPAVTYGFQLAAINSAGQSEWGVINATMPSDVPNKIDEMRVLATTNETLLIGWKRPHDNGAHISEYKMELRNDGQSSVIGETMIVKDAQQEVRRNYMYIFVGLEPATKYSFQVRACSYLGCGPWSEPQLPAQTSDGNSEAPEKLKIICSFDSRRSANFANITWSPAVNARGTVIGYNVTVVGSARYRNGNDHIVTDHIVEWHRIHSNTTHQIQLPLKANTNYTVQLCAINLSGCGTWTDITTASQCSTGSHLQHNFPDDIKLVITESMGQLKILLPRVSERFGFITCYRVYMIKMPTGYTLTDLNHYRPSELNLTSYAKVHYNQVLKPQAYIADEIPSHEFNNEVIIGDRKYSSCVSAEKDHLVLNGGEQVANGTTTGEPVIDDGPLAELTNYTGFVEIHVLGANGEILRKQSTYLSPIQTSSSPLLSMPTTTNSVSPLLSSIGNPSTTTILLCLISGIAIILLIIILILWLLIRRNSDANNDRSSSSARNRSVAAQEKLNSLQRSKHIHTNGLIVNGVLPQTIHSLNYTSDQLTDNETNNMSGISTLPIPVISLPQIYKERSANNNRFFEMEFQLIPKQFDDRTCLASEAEYNAIKNRMPSVKCYDQTRVRLSLIDDKPGSDYYNGNVVAYNNKLYICCETPMDVTLQDFWRMIYEYESSVIVMLTTGCDEQCRQKCCQYWSDDSTKQIGDQFIVNVQSVRIYSDYIIRRFKLSTADQKYTRDVLQFQYMMWKETLTTSAAEMLPSGILRLIKHVNEHYCPDRGPIVVHCCNGLGRSATYIAIDSLLPEIIAGFVNIYECVLHLRYQRNRCIPELQHYMFIYKALLEFAVFGDTEVDVDHFESYYHQIIEEQIDNVNLLNTQFDRLEFIVDESKSCEFALLPENVDKNRFIHVIPYDINRVILPANIDDQSSPYINASFIQGYDCYLTYIATQDPLESTLKDFICMIYEQNVTTIVMLSQDMDLCYWPLTETKYDNYTIKAIGDIPVQNTTSTTAIELQISKLSADQNSNNTVQIVTVYRLYGWSDHPVPANVTLAVLDLCDTILSNMTVGTQSPIVVHCCNGSQRSAIFISLLSLLQQIRVDKRLDVFQTARAHKMQKSSAFQCFEEYAFLYTALMDYVVTRNLCDTSDVVL